ncbi:hypothetical protein [Bacillus licheniformis]|nr:hypothetical protein [Bacillus licheniformis]QAW28744.1 hypothetical protein ETA57_09225 [Bacillus licheniformis]WHF46248.1 hypothetical protein QKW34_08565 [Bacillus licheniformis]
MTAMTEPLINSFQYRSGCLLMSGAVPPKKYIDFKGLAGCILFFTLKYELYVCTKLVRRINMTTNEE